MTFRLGYIFTKGEDCLDCLGISVWALSEGADPMETHYVSEADADQFGLTEYGNRKWVEKRLSGLDAESVKTEEAPVAMKVGDTVKYTPTTLAYLDVPIEGVIEKLLPPGFLSDQLMLSIDTVLHWIPARDCVVVQTGEAK